MKFIYDESPTVGKFVAFYGDGSGAGVFCKTANGEIINADGHRINDESLLDQGYCQWMPLPDSFKLWYEFSE
jgi:hypothetical protein